MERQSMSWKIFVWKWMRHNFEFFVLRFSNNIPLRYRTLHIPSSTGRVCGSGWTILWQVGHDTMKVMNEFYFHRNDTKPPQNVNVRRAYVRVSGREKKEVDLRLLISMERWECTSITMSIERVVRKTYCGAHVARYTQMNLRPFVVVFILCRSIFSFCHPNYH